jgi:hypothetical protein
VGKTNYPDNEIARSASLRERLPSAFLLFAFSPYRFTPRYAPSRNSKKNRFPVPLARSVGIGEIRPDVRNSDYANNELLRCRLSIRDCKKAVAAQQGTDASLLWKEASYNIRRMP